MSEAKRPDEEASALAWDDEDPLQSIGNDGDDLFTDLDGFSAEGDEAVAIDEAPLAVSDNADQDLLNDDLSALTESATDLDDLEAFLDDFEKSLEQAQGDELPEPEPQAAPEDEPLELEAAPSDNGAADDLLDEPMMADERRGDDDLDLSDLNDLFVDETADESTDSADASVADEGLDDLFAGDGEPVDSASDGLDDLFGMEDADRAEPEQGDGLDDLFGMEDADRAEPEQGDGLDDLFVDEGAGNADSGAASEASSLDDDLFGSDEQSDSGEAATALNDGLDDLFAEVESAGGATNADESDLDDLFAGDSGTAQIAADDDLDADLDDLFGSDESGSAAAGVDLDDELSLDADGDDDALDFGFDEPDSGGTSGDDGNDFAMLDLLDEDGNSDDVLLADADDEGDSDPFDLGDAAAVVAATAGAAAAGGAAVAAQRDDEQSGEALELADDEKGNEVSRTAFYIVLALAVVAILGAAGAGYVAMGMASEITQMRDEMGLLQGVVAEQPEEPPIDPDRVIEMEGRLEQIQMILDGPVSQMRESNERVVSEIAERINGLEESIKQLQARPAPKPAPVRRAAAPKPKPTPRRAAPAARPEPPPKPEPPPNWAVNLASLSDRETADRELERFVAAGIKATQQRVQTNGRTWYRLRVSGFNSYQEAKAYAEEVQRSPLVSSTWVAKD